MLRDVLDWVERWLTIEINSSDDNPLFNVAGGRVESGGNFYGGHVGQAMDSLKVALANLCDLIDRQLELVVDEKFNRGLTPNLAALWERSAARWRVRGRSSTARSPATTSRSPPARAPGTNTARSSSG